MSQIEIREAGPHDAAWIVAMIVAEWNTEHVVSGGRTYHPHLLPGFAAERDGLPLGLVTYAVEGDECEIITLNSLLRNAGIGGALIDAVAAAARRAGCARVRLVTTNDNMNALRFYQKRGFRITAIHRDAVNHARAIKPSIPLFGHDGIPLCDELELTLDLEGVDATPTGNDRPDFL